MNQNLAKATLKLATSNLISTKEVSEICALRDEDIALRIEEILQRIENTIDRMLVTTYINRYRLDLMKEAG